MKQAGDVCADTSPVHCQELVKTNDLDRYLSTLLADKEKHRPLFAVYAFDVEINSIAAQVSDPGIGEIRLQWWRDEIDAIFEGNSNNHPIANELQSVVHKYDLPKHLFSNHINAHQFDLYSEPMDSLAALNNYLTATSVAIIDLASRILIGDDALEINFLIEQAGQAHGIAKMLWNLPISITRKQCFLPTDLLQQHGLDSKDVLATGTVDSTVGIRLVIRQLHHLFTEHLQRLRQEQGALHKTVLPAFYPTGLAEFGLKNLLSSDHDPLRHSSSVSQLKMQWILFKKSIFERI